MEASVEGTRRRKKLKKTKRFCGEIRRRRKLIEENEKNCGKIEN
jgi:hypothetical protein